MVINVAASPNIIRNESFQELEPLSALDYTALDTQSTRFRIPLHNTKMEYNNK